MHDTRVHQIQSLATEALALTTAMRDEDPDNVQFAEDLTDLRRYLNWVVSRTRSMISRGQCTAHTMSGGRCEGLAGHSDGLPDELHSRLITGTNEVYTWTDASEAELIDKWEAKQL